MNFLWAIAAIIASYFIQALITPKATQPKPASLDEFDLPQSDDGTPRPVIFGDRWTSDWVILWYGDYRTTPVKSSPEKK